MTCKIVTLSYILHQNTNLYIHCILAYDNYTTLSLIVYPFLSIDCYIFISYRQASKEFNELY